MIARRLSPRPASPLARVDIGDGGSAGGGGGMRVRFGSPFGVLLGDLVGGSIGLGFVRRFGETGGSLPLAGSGAFIGGFGKFALCSGFSVRCGGGATLFNGGGGGGGAAPGNWICAPDAAFSTFADSGGGGATFVGVFGFNRRLGTVGGNLPLGGCALAGDFSHGFGGDGGRLTGVRDVCCTGGLASEATEVRDSDASELGDGGNGGATPGPIERFGNGRLSSGIESFGGAGAGAGAGGACGFFTDVGIGDGGALSP